MSKPRALLSVTDKTGIVDFGKGLAGLGFEILSTGGTAKALREGGVEVIDVSEVTGFPEMLDGRVKTLHPMVHGGLLGDTHNPSHVEAMAAAGIRPISVVAVNLYQFEKTVAAPHTLDDAVESIDIGGPAMIRASAKNHASVAVVVEPKDYDAVLAAIECDSLDELRPKLAAKAFRHTAYYDSVIWLRRRSYLAIVECRLLDMARIHTKQVGCLRIRSVGRDYPRLNSCGGRS